jgi:hypothetical protein
MNLTDLQYPVYISPVKHGLLSVYKPAIGFLAGGPLPTPTPYPNQRLLEYFKALIASTNLNLEGYLVSNSVSPEELVKILNSQEQLPKDLRYYVADCYSDDNKLKYEFRHRWLRLEVNNIAEFKKVIDLSVKMVNNPNEIKQAYLGFIEAGDVGYTLRTVDSLQNEILLKVQK